MSPIGSFSSPLTFDAPAINRGLGWSTSRNEFFAPVDGIYYFYLAFVTPLHDFVAGVYLKNGILFRVSYNFIGAADSDTIACGFLLDMKYNETVYFSIESAYQLVTPLVFAGFLYSPLFSKVSRSITYYIG